MDRLSNLPNEIICHIGSFLSAKEAIRTKVLSKNWRNLIIIKPSLVFNPKCKISGRLKYFVDRVLAQHDSFRLIRFSLKLSYVNISQYILVNACLHNVLKRGVYDLELDINVKEDYSLPSELFTCKSVVKLKLGYGFAIGMIPEDALLPALKTLVLDSVRFYDTDGCAFQRLLSACPVLEELVIDDLNWEYWKWSRTVSSPSLKRFTTRRKDWEPIGDEVDFESISFDTPSLAYLEYPDLIQYEYPVVNLGSLVEAKLNLGTEAEYDWVNRSVNPTNFIKGLRNVKILSIEHPDTLWLLFFNFKEAVPTFENLLHLSVENEPHYCWSPLQILLEKSPNLRTLTIEGTLHYQDFKDLKFVCECLLGYSFLLSCPLELFKLTTFNGEIGEMVQIKHLLENMPYLVLLEVHVEATTYGKKLQIMKDLLMLPRASSKCKVQVKFS